MSTVTTKHEHGYKRGDRVSLSHGFLYGDTLKRGQLEPLVVMDAPDSVTFEFWTLDRWLADRAFKFMFKWMSIGVAIVYTYVGLWWLL